MCKYLYVFIDKQPSPLPTSSNENDPNRFIVANLQILNPICNYFLPGELNTVLMDFQKSNLKIKFLNINSIPIKLDCYFEELQVFFERKFDYIGFCETKLTNDIESLFTIPNYYLVTNNTSRISGGLSLYVRNNIKTKIMHNLTVNTKHTETLFVETVSNIDHNPIVVGVVYRRPKSNFHDFKSTLTNLLSILENNNSYNYIIGDFNLDLLQASSQNMIMDTISTFNSHYYHCTISHPTRVTQNSATLLDHIWSNNIANNLCNGIVHTQISDHFPIFSLFNTLRQPIS